MRKTIFLCISMVMALLVIGESKAQQFDIVEPNTLIAGKIIIKGEKVYLDDGEYEILLLNVNDTTLEGMQVEIAGDYAIVDDKAALQVTKINIYEGGELSLVMEVEASENK